MHVVLLPPLFTAIKRRSRWVNAWYLIRQQSRMTMLRCCNETFSYQITSQWTKWQRVIQTHADRSDNVTQSRTTLTHALVTSDMPVKIVDVSINYQTYWRPESRRHCKRHQQLLIWTSNGCLCYNVIPSPQQRHADTLPTVISLKALGDHAIGFSRDRPQST